MSDGLLPCPFCGGEAEAYKDGGFWWVECVAMCASPRFGLRSEAIAAWNRRAPAPAGPDVSRLLAAAKWFHVIALQWGHGPLFDGEYANIWNGHLAAMAEHEPAGAARPADAGDRECTDSQVGT